MDHIYCSLRRYYLIEIIEVQLLELLEHCNDFVKGICYWYGDIVPCVWSYLFWQLVHAKETCVWTLHKPRLERFFYHNILLKRWLFLR